MGFLAQAVQVVELVLRLCFAYTAMPAKLSNKVGLCSVGHKCKCIKHKKANATQMAAKLSTSRRQDKIRAHTILKLPMPVVQDEIAIVHGPKELVWLALQLQLDVDMVVYLYENLCRPIFTVPIPGNPRRQSGMPTKAMLDQAIKRVIKFYNNEEKLGERSAVYQALMIASAEEKLSFDWDAARKRVSGAKFDKRKEVDQWKDCLAMSHGDSQGEVEIAICGTRKMTLNALTAVLCHEGLHNLARRTRPGQKYLSSETEHVAMALMGDPQL